MMKKVVIIDDSSTQLDILKKLFINDNWEVCGVRNAKIGYESIFDFAPDLIITDALMPVIGGFQLAKQIRNNVHISKIPLIIYSVIDGIDEKLYVHKEYNEYFLKKDENYEKLLSFSHNVVNRHPLSPEYKENILKVAKEHYRNLELEKEKKEENKNPAIAKIIEEIYTFDDLKNDISKNTNFVLEDEKIFLALFFSLAKFLKYDLSVLNVYSFDNKENISFFDIRNIILSPILKDNILNKFNSKKSMMYKKYSPNLEVVTNENDFNSKIELNFSYKEKNIAQISFFSKEENKWQNDEEIENIEKSLFEFFKARYITRASNINKKDSVAIEYQKLDRNFDYIQKTKDMYFATILIHASNELEQENNYEDIDVISSKISEIIIDCLDKTEKIYKKDKNEYDILICAKDENSAKNRFESIVKCIENVTNEVELDPFIIASSCNINDSFDINQAKKNVKNLIEEFNYQEKVVIYNVEQ